VFRTESYRSRLEQHGGRSNQHGWLVPDILSIPGFADPFSSLSHLFGAALFAVLSIFLLRRGRGDALRMASLAVFSFGAVALLTISGLTHLIGANGAGHGVMRRLDHAAIFVLIACSFTPMHIILFRGRQRWVVLVLVWTIAILGISIKTIYFNAISPPVGTAIYIGMGWIGIWSWLAVVRHYGFEFARPIMWGGIAYTIGGVLDSAHWPVIISGVVQWHEIFHIAVLIGLGFHWAFAYSIANYPVSPLSQQIGPSTDNATSHSG
jgi:channel protein (hemolysin III family)